MAFRDSLVLLAAVRRIPRQIGLRLTEISTRNCNAAEVLKLQHPRLQYIDGRVSFIVTWGLVHRCGSSKRRIKIGNLSCRDKWPQ